MKELDTTPQAAVPASSPLAVIDIGATSIRMLIAQPGESGAMRRIETLTQAVETGRDTFTGGRISSATTERCVAALRTFKRMLDEYGVADTAIKAVATSAVREAANRDEFLDRLYVATGLDVETISDGDVNRYTYLSVKPAMENEPAFNKADTMVVEVGGGSTRVLALKGGNVAVAQSYRLGALRLREIVEGARAPAARMPDLLAGPIGTSVKQMRQNAGFKGKPVLLLLGGDARFAASLLVEDRSARQASRVRVSALAKLTDGLLRMSADEIVRRHRISYPDAETLGPALLTYVRLAESYELPSVFVTDASLRDGILAEMAGHAWTEELTRQVERSAIELGNRYAFDESHAREVARCSRVIFRALQNEHRLTPRHELVLTVAALLHEIGLFVSDRSHHKHSMYLIRNSDVFGLGERETEIAAVVARYHRKATPQATHPEFAAMDRETRIAVAKLAAILRVADALDRRHGSAEGRSVSAAVEPGRLVITMGGIPDTIVEELGLQLKGDLFTRMYGMQVALKAEGT
jgi:exopolyphosphatase/guanosine-5'-triphosphate,3'-diphosphate pyrophosphatase